MFKILSADSRGKGQQPDAGNEADLGSHTGIDARVAGREGQLAKAGFTADEISAIRHRVADLDVRIYKLALGDSFHGAVDDAVFLSKETGSATVFKFYNDLIIVGKEDTAESICAANAYRFDGSSRRGQTPEQFAEKEAGEARERAAQRSHLEALSSLDFADPVAPLKWLATLEGWRGHMVPPADRNALLSAFAEAGYTPRMNTGDMFDRKDQENFKGYIIGQALVGIRDSGYIRPVIHSSIEHYQKDFSLSF